ncbi:MAG: glycosyltransferase family 39 protein [Candidatus Omnitrophica bacterium]|nr:glycosyltransferase family 39 protein [Candidatus Omnitrophota bacterium]
MDHDAHADSMDGRQELTGGGRRLFGGGPLGWLAALVFAGCGLYALIFVYHGARLVLYPFDVDNSEAYLVYQGMRLAEGEFLYPPLEEPPYLVDNYPPFYPALTGLGFLFMPPNFHWPRLISFLSTMATAALAGYWVFLLTRRRSAGILSGLIYLSFYHVNDWGALARVDALGAALAMGGLILFEKTRSWKAALPLMACALLTRQTLFAAPLAILAALLTSNEHKAALRYTGGLLTIGLISGAALLLLSGGRAWSHLVIYNANEYRLSDVMNYVNQWLRLYTVWGCAPLLILVWRHPRLRPGSGDSSSQDRTSSLLFWFTLFALGEALMCGKIGSAPNYLLSLVAASCAGLGWIYHSFLELAEEASIPEQRHILPLLVFLCACALQLGSTWHWPHSRMVFSETPTRQDAQQVRWLANNLARSKGPILSDRAGVALMAGHPPVFQPFILTQLIREGKWDPSILLQRIRSREFLFVVLQFSLDDPNWDRERFTPDMIEALRESYALDRKLVRTGSRIVRYFLYKPKTP